MLHIDLNCDTGEGIGNEESLLPFITSANIACGGHAGDEETAKRVIGLCLHHGVQVGAHPSYPDREHFGRVDLVGKSLQAKDLHYILAEQLFRFLSLCRQEGAVLHHVKPHGALYNRVAWDREAAHFLCTAIVEVVPAARLYELSGSGLEEAAEAFGLHYVHEVFADRSYQDDGSLTPRSEDNALIHDAREAVQQVRDMVEGKRVKTVSGAYIPIRADTVCIHGDGVNALEYAQKIHEYLSNKS